MTTTTVEAVSSLASTSRSSSESPGGGSVSAAVAALVERTGVPLVQENGQRRYGPPPDWPAGKPPPARGCEVFVGKIPRDCFEVRRHRLQHTAH